MGSYFCASPMAGRLKYNDAGLRANDNYGIDGRYLLQLNSPTAELLVNNTDPQIQPGDH